MEHLILSLSIVLVAISNLITIITVNKRITRLEDLVMTNSQITNAVANEFIKNKKANKKENKHEV